MKRHPRTAAAGVALAAVLVSAAFAQSGATKLSAREAGARYGQAVGAGLSCREAKTAKDASDLQDQFTGVELAEFQKEAALVVSLWKKSLSCEDMREINMCRVMKERNCRDALREIGPRGTAYPGLLDQTETPRESP